MSDVKLVIRDKEDTKEPELVKVFLDDDWEGGVRVRIRRGDGKIVDVVSLYDDMSAYTYSSSGFEWHHAPGNN